MKTFPFADLSLSLRNYYFNPHRPITAFLHLTTRCNLKCGFCELGSFANQALDREELSFPEIVQIIDQLRDWGVKRLYLGGGEPFMRRDLWDILENLSSKDMVCSGLVTNGTLFDRVGQKKKEILKKSVRVLNISLYSHESGLHDSLRGVPGTFKKVISFLERSAKEDGPKVYITSVITKDTFRGIPELIRFLSNYRVKHIGFQPVNFHSNYSDYKVVENKDRFLLRGKVEIGELGRVVEEGIKISKELKLSTNLSFLKLFLKEYFLYANTDILFFDKLIKGFRCSNGFNYLYINSKGDLLSCSLLPKVDNVIGKDLKEIWRKNARLFKKWSKREKFYPECQSCFCGSAANFRQQLIYHPISNASLVAKVFPYYLARVL